MEDFADLKKKLTKLQREAHKAEGALEQANEKLREQYGCKTIKSATARLCVLQEEEEEAERCCEEAEEKFRKKWDGILEKESG